MFHVAALFMTILFLAATPALAADDIDFELPSLGNAQLFRWQDVDSQMASQEYDKAVRKNKRAILKVARNYVEGHLNAMGVPEQGIKITGATVGFLVEGARYHLNKSRTVAVEVREVINTDRFVFLKYKLGW